MAGLFVKYALVLGAAYQMPTDVAAFDDEFGVMPSTVIAVNMAGVHYESRIDHWATLHPKVLSKWRKERQKVGGNDDFETWSNHGEWTDHLLVDSWVGGSSGLFAISLAFHLGFERVLLCGVPIDTSNHIGGIKRWGDKEVARYREHWRFAFWQLMGGVRSMSGWTQLMLGPPTWEWLRNDPRDLFGTERDGRPCVRCGRR